MKVTVKLNPGESLDRLTILLLKQELACVDTQKDINLLTEQLGSLVDSDLGQRLYSINAALWLLEDKIRGEDKSNFMLWASSIFSLNEIRSDLKRLIDESVGVKSMEGKIYESKGRSKSICS